MLTIDITNDRKATLVCNDDLGKPRYEPHDGSPIEIYYFAGAYVRQFHFVASALRDGADQQGLVLGAFKKADPSKWTVLGK